LFTGILELTGIQKNRVDNLFRIIQLW